MNVLSLCDGMSCGHIALKELGITVDSYYASEIDKNSIKVTQDNFPDTKQLGDVTKLNPEDLAKSLPKIDLVMFGSPCRSLSKATAGREQYNNGLKGISGLFYDCNEILNRRNSAYSRCSSTPRTSPPRTESVSTGLTSR